MLSHDIEDTVAGGGFELQQGVPLATYTAYRVGGEAEWFSLPRTPLQLAESWRWAAQQRVPVTLLGAGSNLIISDRGVPGLVICTRYLRGASFEEATASITAAAGEPLPNLAWKAARRGWRGFEWAVGIPGTVGGAVFMNAGAHGACCADSLVCAEVISSEGTVETFSPEDFTFAYRTSSLQSQFRLVSQATFRLSPGHVPETVMADTQSALKRRRSTQPYHLPSCGSVFRNPPRQAAGQLIEQTGLKGYQIGQAQVSTLHANFIVNLGGATAQDILSLIGHVRSRVRQQWGIDLHPEVRLLGEFETCYGERN